MQRSSNKLERHSVKHRQRAAGVPKVVANVTYDHETGQVYSEREVIFRKKQNSDWIGEFKTPGIVTKTKPNSVGARSLLDMVAIKCAKLFRSFTPEHFEMVPWKVAERLWMQLESTHSESFHAWRTLAVAYNAGDEFGDRAYRYHIEIKQPPLSLREYFSGLVSPSSKWLTSLRISPRQISIPDLVAVATITNLVVLDLSDGQLHVDCRPSTFDERLMRSWAELASSGKAFQHLQVLLLGWQDTVSDWIFKYLDCFPSLCYVITTDCKNMHQKNRAEWEATATTHGWIAPHAKKGVKILRPLMDDPTFHRCTISNLYYHSHDLYNNLSRRQSDGEATFLPLIECWLGTPRPWTHVLDEFPGTRTIWFENTKTSTHMDKESSEPNKRLHDAVVRSPMTASPPRKRMNNSTNARRRIPLQSASDLLADLGGGAKAAPG